MFAAYFDDTRHGNRRLWQVFWIFGVLVSQMLFAVLLAVYRIAPAWTFVFATAGFIVYTAWIMRQVWVNAFNVHREIYAHIARALTVAWALNAVLVCGFLVLGRLTGQPLPFF